MFAMKCDAKLKIIIYFCTAPHGVFCPQKHVLFQFINSPLLFGINNVKNMFIFRLNQANHRFTTKMQRRIYGHSVDAVIRPLDEEKAVQASADLIGELFLFSVLAFPVLLAYVLLG